VRRRLAKCLLQLSKSARHAVGDQIGSLFARAYNLYSESGQIKLSSRNWRAELIVELNLLSDMRDLQQLMGASRRLGAIYLNAALRQATSDPFPTNYTERVRASGVVNMKNKAITELIAKLLDGPAWLRRVIIKRGLMRRDDIASTS
jgi:5-(hydroxymethyl)furfural/furfural oxidase